MLSRAFVLVASGLVLGIAGAAVFSRVIAGYLFATRAGDIGTYVIVAALFLLAGLMACATPLRRATTIDPLIALRTE